MSTAGDPMENQATERREANTDKLVTAYTLKDPYKAEITKNALRDEGISPDPPRNVGRSPASQEPSG